MAQPGLPSPSYYLLLVVGVVAAAAAVFDVIPLLYPPPRAPLRLPPTFGFPCCRRFRCYTFSTILIAPSSSYHIYIYIYQIERDYMIYLLSMTTVHDHYFSSLQDPRPLVPHHHHYYLLLYAPPPAPIMPRSFTAIIAVAAPSQLQDQRDSPHPPP